MKSVKQVVTAVCRVMKGAKPEVVLADHRGSPRAADLRAVSMYVWRHIQHNQPCYTATGAAFKRDRRNVARGLKRIADKRIPNAMEMGLILQILKED